MPVIEFRVFGTPKGQPRIRRRGQGGVYDPGTANDWFNCVYTAACTARKLPPLQGPLAMTLIVLFPRTQKLLTAKQPNDRIYCVKKPDFDNCEKCIADAIVASGLIVDDCLICHNETDKFFVARDEPPGAEVKIFTLGEP